ncbi:UDP-N-acetylmuramate dehydrogenase [Bisgaardia hudsonensis]|uniref:UDP-N-acetylenolpyruvoylglucosamine reductase n=1 Tax=Bisgaardia hudsonensis TaxID=109472 RepID=A0A4R2MWW1_9PAST|nr:UDP-N-acetylmuramate dehydrogenase [Bisgaardia hudsonensis]QLB13755.1 UDP-N-acetylenolpyruvoylglucosamine reductase [Bisgaardia hudsonensis]TCP11060.1 UDP-N-acetylmuramate dehydrogenase [Bisgaardia hudsonensis]
MQDIKEFHTFSVVCKAKNVIKITALEQLKEQWQQAKIEDNSILIVGQGSNLLFLDDFEGTIFLNRLVGITHTENEQYHYLHVEGGEIWHDLVKWSLENHIYGLENLALIPGCVGSAPIQNIGAYGVEFKDVCDYVDVMQLDSGEVFRLNCNECQFGYRESIFKHQYKDNYMIISVGLKLAKNWEPVLKYGSLAGFDKNTVTAQQIFDEVCSIRQTKLPDPNVFGNAGSFFKNPTVAKNIADELKNEYPDMPYFLQEDGSVKLAAGWLIEQCGLKGYQIGGAAVHQNQALVILNKENATSSDIVELAHHIRQSVAIKFDVYLQPEVRFIGKYGEVNAEATIS